ncbi:hypothetical protein Bbelb_114600, partial [Branchiostoma belcheri]
VRSGSDSSHTSRTPAQTPPVGASAPTYGRKQRISRACSASGPAGEGVALPAGVRSGSGSSHTPPTPAQTPPRRENGASLAGYLADFYDLFTPQKKSGGDYSGPTYGPGESRESVGLVAHLAPKGTVRPDAVHVHFEANSKLEDTEILCVQCAMGLAPRLANSLHS